MSKHMSRLSLVWWPLISTNYLLTPWSRVLGKLTGSQLVKKVCGTQRFICACHMSFSTNSILYLGISQLWHKTRPGHCNMEHWRITDDWYVVCVFLEVSFFQSDLLPPRLELVLYSHKCTMFLSAVGNIVHLCEWGTSCEGGAISCCREHSVNHGWILWKR